MKQQSLSTQQKQRLNEYFKCKNDPIYFMEEYIKLALTGGDKSVPLYNRQKDFVNLFRKEHHLIVLKSRQTGLSTITQMICAYLTVFYKNIVIGVISKSGSESTDFCKKVSSMIDSLPLWLKPKFEKRTEQSFILDNGSKFYASQVNESNPEGVLRGYVINLLILDEAAFIPRIDDAYTACAPTLFNAQKLAKQQNIPFGTIIISTPNKTIGKGKWYYETWKSAINNESIFKPFKLHWTMVDEYKNDPDWYKTQCRLLNNVKWKIAQELNMQFVASNNSFFESNIIELLNKCYIDPINTISVGRYSLKIFEAPQKDKFYLISIDTASEGGADSSAIIVNEFETMAQVAEFKHSNIRVDDFCEVVAKVATIYSNNLIIPESNSYGNQVCEYLTNKEGFFNIYKQEVKQNTIEKSKKKKFRYGIYTGPQNRPLIIDALYTTVVQNPNIVRSEALALELIGLVDKNNKVEADDGEHDDLAICLGFGSYVKLYDPPLGMAKKFTEPETYESMENIVGWNDWSSINVAPELSEVFDFEDDDIYSRQDKTNKLIDKYIKNNLLKINKEQHSNIIDIEKLLKSKKN